jgi:hypothetical protein
MRNMAGFAIIRPIRNFSVFSLALLVTSCSKKQSPTASPSASATPVLAAVPATASAAQETPHFTAEIVAHEEFQKTFAPRMMFRLEPYAGTDSGWTIRIAPISESGGPAIDCIGAVETPLHGDTKKEIEPPQNGASKDPAWRQREFDYAASEPDCRAAWNWLNNANYTSNLTDKQREEASAKLAEIPTRHGKITILDARFGPATPQNERGTIELLRFDVDLNSSSSTASAAGKSTPSAANSAIRSVDLKPFIESHLGELNPDFADLATDCGDDQKPLQSLAPALYGDLDGDGQDEAAVEGWSCLSGNGGADFWGVLKLLPDGKLAVLPMEPMPKTFKGRARYAGLRGHMSLEIKDGRLHEVYGIYKDADPNCCATGGERRFIYRWDGHRFALDDIIDVPAEKGGT